VFFAVGDAIVPLHGVIFDLDGTLADTLPVCFAAFREVFEAQLGVTRSDEEIHALFGPSEEGIIAQQLPERVDESYRDYLAAYERLHAACPGLLTALTRRWHGWPSMARSWPS
jgi:beta-phosphoglucomutase-like phosphatase (HAD superfamily)